MGDDEDGTLIGLDILLQPDGGVQIQVVGGLVQQEDLGVHQDQTGQVDPGLLAAGQVGKELFPEGFFNAQTGTDLFQPGLGLVAAPGLKGHLEPVVPGQQVLVPAGELVGEVVHLLLHGFQVVEGRPQNVLHRKAHGVDRDLGDEAQPLAGGDDHIAAVGKLLAGEDSEEGGLTRAVAAQDAHPLAGVHLEGKTVEDGLTHLVFFCDFSYRNIDHVLTSSDRADIFPKQEWRWP